VLRWALHTDPNKLNLAQLTELEALVSQYTTKRTGRAWLYREKPREILERKKVKVVSETLQLWCTNVMRSKVEPMKDVARLIRRHFEGIVACAHARQTNGSIEASMAWFKLPSASTRLHALQNYANRPPSHRRQTRFLRLQLACALKRIAPSSQREAYPSLLGSHRGFAYNY
jgi:hypothetical protein